MIEEKFFTRNPSNQRMVGLINHRKPKAPTPALILCHGFKGVKEQKYQEYLARRLSDEFVVIRFDFTNGIGESDGDIFNITVGHYLEDLKTVIRFAKNELSYVERRKIALGGASLGGLVSALAAAEDRGVEALILLSAVFDMGILKDISSLLTPFEDWQKKGYAYFKSESKKMSVKVGFNFYKEGITYDMLRETIRITCPTLIIHGTKDESVPLSHSQAYYENLRGEKKFFTIKDAPHTLKEKNHLREAEREIGVWLKKYLE